MDVLALSRMYLPSMAFKRSTHQVLSRDLNAEQIRELWSETRKKQSELQRDRPNYSVGLNLLMRYFEWDCAFYSAARAQGFPTQDVGKWIQDIQWQIIGPGMRFSYALSRLRSKTQHVRVRWILDLMFTFLFTKPFQRAAVPPLKESDIAFDVTVCPIAQYFQDRGVPELTRYAACDLDYRMAQIWQVQLDRDQTLATGGNRCDFRFTALPPDSTRNEESAHRANA